MRSELSKNEVERLFVEAADGALAEADERALEVQLDRDPELKARFEQYQRAISALKDAPRERAPEGLASTILRRTRRRRFQVRAREVHFAHLPAEVIIPLVLAAVSAALWLLSSP